MNLSELTAKLEGFALSGERAVTAELTALLERFAVSEARVITWGLGILAVGLALSFLPLPRIARALLTVLALLALSALEIVFLWTGQGFTFYLPSLAGGWLWAALYFACFALFLAAQIYLFLRALELIEYGLHIYAGGMNLIVIICAIIFFALYFLAAIVSALLWPPLVAPFDWAANHFLYLYLGAQAIVAFKLMEEDKSKARAVFVVIPLHFAAISAIWLMIIDMIPAMIIAALAFLVLAGMAVNGTPEQRAAEDAARAAAANDPERKAAEERWRQYTNPNIKY